MQLPRPGDCNALCSRSRPRTSTAAADGKFNGETWGVDALYCYAKWRRGTPQLWRQLQVNGEGLDELAERRGHAAGVLVTRDQDEIVTGQMALVGLDAVGSSADNAGAWRLVTIDWKPVADADTGAAASGFGDRSDPAVGHPHLDVRLTRH